MPVDVFLVESAHVALANLAAGHGPIKEGGRALHFEIKLPVHLIHDVALREVAFIADQRSIVSVLLFVLPSGGKRIIAVFELEVGLRVRQGVIYAHVLAQGLLNDAVRCEVLVRVDQHLTGCPVLLDQLEEGIVAKRNALIGIVEENLVPSQSCILELLQPLIDLIMNLGDSVSAEVLEGTFDCCTTSFNEVTLILVVNFFFVCLFWSEVVLLMQESLIVARLLAKISKADHLSRLVLFAFVQEAILFGTRAFICLLWIVKHSLQVWERSEELRVLFELCFKKLLVGDVLRAATASTRKEASSARGGKQAASCQEHCRWAARPCHETQLSQVLHI